MNNIYGTATTSASHIFGNVAKALQMYLNRKLPSGLLKGQSVSTTIAPRFFKLFKNRRTDWEKKERPFMIIRPTFETPDPDTFLQGTLYTKQYGTEIAMSRDGVQDFLKDKKNGIVLGFKVNRNKIVFDVGIQFNTQLQMIDTWHYLFNTMRWDVPEYIPTSLESMIPKLLLVETGEILGIDIYRQENISIMLKYLRMHSMYPITYKMQNSTSQDEYFLYYKQNLLTTFSELQMDEGSKKNMADEFYTLSFKCTVEFNNPGLYLLIGERNLYKKLKVDLHTITGCKVDTALDIGTYTPIYTYDAVDNDTRFVREGYQAVISTMIKTDEDKNGKDDYVNIEYFLSAKTKVVLKNTIAQGQDPEILFKVKLLKDLDGNVVEPAFDMEWTNMILTIHNTDKYSTYRLVIYCNLAYLNNRLMELGYDDLTDQQNLSGKSKHGYDI